MIPFEAILKGETNDSRFEKFCRELLQKSQGITLVSTSATWDRGRDAVSIRASSGTHAEVVCCTIEKDIETKVVNDGKRLAETGTVPQHVYYCSSLDLTEHRIDQLVSDFRAQFPKPCGITFLGGRKLADIAQRYPDIFREWYHAEVRSAEAALAAFQAKRPTSETRGLRLALLSFGSGEAKELRREITTRAVLDILSTCGGCTSQRIAENLSADLGLPNPLDENYVNSILQTTTLQGLTNRTAQNAWELTDRGVSEAKSVSPEAAWEVLSGRTIVRDALQRLIGKKIGDQQYDRIWSSLLDFFSEYFYTSGLAIISAVNVVLTGKTPRSTGSSLDKVIEEGARKVRAHVATPELGDEIEQAIKDVFAERTGSAFEWLSRLCERFVALCAMGLEGTSSDEIRGILIRNRLVLDTDIILTALCPSEPDHHAAQELITHFREIGGRVVLSPSVLEEVAYHAWIAEREFRESTGLFGKLSPDDLRKYLRNTFVRAFFLLGWNGEATLDQWDLYINQFRGETPHDHSKLLKMLQTTLLAERLPDLNDDSLQKDVTLFMKESAARSRSVNVSQLGQDEVGKAETDGKIVGCISAARENLRQQGSQDTIVLLTSSTRLRRADHQFRSRLGTPNAIMSPAALSYLLSLIPGVNLGISTLRRALFEFRDSGRLPDTQRLALKVLKASGLYDVPWATRGTLEHHLDSELRREAEKMGERVEAVRERFDSGDPSINPAQILLNAVKDMAVDDKREAELRAAQRRIAELEDQISEVATANKKGRGQR